MMRKGLVFLIIVICVSVIAIGLLLREEPQMVRGFSSLEFSIIQADGKPSTTTLQAQSVFFVKPGKAFKVLVDSEHGGQFNVDSDWCDRKGTVSLVSDDDPTDFNLRAPHRAGPYEFPVTCMVGGRKGEDVYFVSVMHRRDEVFRKDMQNEYAYPQLSGRVPASVRSNRTAYLPPAFFIEIDTRIRDCWIMEGYRFSDLIISESDKTKTLNRFVYLDPRLLHKMSVLKQRLAQKGVYVPVFKVLSGFRSPLYNRKIGGTRFSRHMYGDAIDFIIDVDDDGKMDDIDGDGAIDRGDALVVARLIDVLEKEKAVAVGGTGIYEFNSRAEHPVSIHMDTRGDKRRWGYSYRRGKREVFEW